MKLRNKLTGEIATLTLSTNGEDMIIMGNDMYAHITKLSELKDYEDYEESKDYWYIDYDGGILCRESDDSSAEKMMISMGNHFGTLEEAEKAVEKLKAWKRLKEAGFGFGGWTHTPITKSLAGYNLHIKAYTDKLANYMDDLDLLFGGEE